MIRGGGPQLSKANISVCKMRGKNRCICTSQLSKTGNCVKGLSIISHSNDRLELNPGHFQAKGCSQQCHIYYIETTLTYGIWNRNRQSKDTRGILLLRSFCLFSCLVDYLFILGYFWCLWWWWGVFWSLQPFYPEFGSVKVT